VLRENVTLGGAALLLGLGLGLACDGGPGPEVCYGICGPGTACVEQRCLPAPAEAEPTPAPEPNAKGRKGRKGRKRPPNAEGTPLEPFRPVSDAHVPRYDANEVQTIGPGSGSERLPDHTIREHLGRLETPFNRCIATAAEYSPQELAAGTVEFEFGIRPTGRISGVNVKAPSHLRVFGIVPCLRKALYDHRFPSYDGPTTGVTYQFRVE